MDNAQSDKDPHVSWASARTACDDAEADSLLCCLCDTTASSAAGLLAQVETLADVLGVERLPEVDVSRRLVERIAIGLRSLS